MAPKVLRWPTLDDVNLRLREEIAERERAEQQVRDIVEASPSGVCVVDQSGTIILVNRAIEQLFGYTREELVGQGVDMLVPEGDRSRHADLRAGFMAAPEARPMGAGRDLFARRKDGSQIAVEIGLCPLDIRGQGAVLASVIDVTERRRAQAQLKEYAERLEISNAELEKFAYVVSHDIKAPLRGISSVAQWLAQDFAAVVDKESKENLDLMLERTDRLGRLINGILDYSRAGRGDPDIEQIDSSALIDDVIDSIDPPPSIRVLREGTFPVVVFNETKLRQVFQNLIDNAIQHLGKPRGEIIASCREAGEFFEFSVRDDGVGIPERHFERIFELFQTLRPKDETGTTGAGLAIAKRIIETNGGAIRVASTEGRGTEFVFTVPKLRRLGVTEGTDEAVSA
jgi:PAS domain S-box-containing protein